MRTVPRRVLIIRLGALGDVLLATPLLRALRAAWPNSEIDWLVRSELSPLLEANPHLSRVYPADAPGTLRRLRERHYDLVIDLQNKPKTAVLRSLLGAGAVKTLRKRDTRQTLRALVGRERPARAPHAVDLNLTIAQALNVPARGRELELRLTPAALAEVAPLLRGRPRWLWGLAPGSRWATKRWPASRFAELGRQAHGHDARVLLLGGPADAALFDELRVQLGELVWADTRALSVGGLAAAIAACERVVTNDSGPAHIAAALARPVYVLFGPTSPERWRHPPLCP
jgi:heptosyltransferase II